MIIMSLSKNTSYIWTMLQFSKSKATNIFVLDSSFYIIRMLLGSQVKKSFHVQEPMYTIFYGESGIIVDIGSADHTELIWVL